MSAARRRDDETPGAQPAATAGETTSDPHRHAERRARPHGRGPAHGARQPPPRGRLADGRGRQGRQRRPRAEEPRRAGASPPGWPRGRPARGSASCSTPSRSCTTSSRSPATRARTSRSSTRPPASRPRSTSAARRSATRTSSASPSGCSTSPRGADFCVIAGSLPPGAETSAYGELIAAPARASASRRCSTPTASRCAPGCGPSPPVVAPNVAEAEEAVGYEFTDAEDLAAGLAGLIDMGAEQAIITTGLRLRRDHRRRRTRGAGSRRRSIRSRRSRASAPATPSSPATCSARRAGRPDSTCLAYGVACGAESTQHLGAGMLDAPRSSDWSTGSG